MGLQERILRRLFRGNGRLFQAYFGPHYCLHGWVLPLPSLTLCEAEDEGCGEVGCYCVHYHSAVSCLVFQLSEYDNLRYVARGRRGVCGEGGSSCVHYHSVVSCLAF